MAIAAPIPREPPVTSATSPASFLVTFVLIIFFSIRPRPCLARQMGAPQVHARLEANGRDHTHGQRRPSAKFRRRACRFRRANPGAPEERWRCLFSFAF